MDDESNKHKLIWMRSMSCIFSLHDNDDDDWGFFLFNLCCDFFLLLPYFFSHQVQRKVKIPVQSTEKSFFMFPLWRANYPHPCTLDSCSHVLFLPGSRVYAPWLRFSQLFRSWHWELNFSLRLKLVAFASASSLCKSVTDIENPTLHKNTNKFNSFVIRNRTNKAHWVSGYTLFWYIFFFSTAYCSNRRYESILHGEATI